MITYLKQNKTTEDILKNNNIDYEENERLFGERFFTTVDSLDTLEEKIGNEDEFIEIIDNTYLGVYKNYYVRDGYLIKG